MYEEDEGSSKTPPPFSGGESAFDQSLRRLADLDRSLEEAKARVSELTAEFDNLSWQLSQYMMSTGCKSKTLDGIRFTQTERIYSKVEDKDALRTWIMNNDAYDLLMAVHASKLTAYVNECKENGQEIPPGVNPNFIKYSVKIKPN
jgi:hypothetical protein